MTIIFDKLLYTFNDAALFFRTHSWTIFMIMVGLYMLRSQINSFVEKMSGKGLDKTKGRPKISRQEEMRLVRARQQERLDCSGAMLTLILDGQTRRFRLRRCCSAGK